MTPESAKTGRPLLLQMPCLCKPHEIHLHTQVPSPRPPRPLPLPALWTQPQRRRTLRPPRDSSNPRARRPPRSLSRPERAAAANRL